MASIGPITFEAQTLGGGNVRITAHYQLQFTNWEVKNHAEFIELLQLFEQEVSMDKHATGSPVDNAYQWNYTHSTVSGDDQVDKPQGTVFHQNTTIATAATLTRNVTKDLKVWKEDVPPNELYLVARVIPHYRGTLRTSGMKQVTIP